MGKIYYLMGKSASGKDTVYKRLLKECPKIRPIVPYTTRPMREGETDGIEYHFITADELERFQKSGKIIEVRTYKTSEGPWSYATIDDGCIERGKETYLAIGTLESYEKLRDYFGADMIVPLYLEVDDNLRRERALLRENSQKIPNYAEMNRRFLADEIDFSPDRLKNCGINRFYKNEDLNECIAEIKKNIE